MYIIHTELVSPLLIVLRPFDFFISSSKVIIQGSCSERAVQLQLKESLGFQEKNAVTFLKHKTKRANFVSNALSCAPHVWCRRVRLCFTSFSLPMCPALGTEKCLFESVVSSPQTGLHVIPEENVCQQQPVSSQCNNSSNENGTSNERIEREVAPTAEFVRTLFWTSGRITTGSSA